MKLNNHTPAQIDTDVPTRMFASESPRISEYQSTSTFDKSVYYYNHYGCHPSRCVINDVIAKDLFEFLAKNYPVDDRRIISKTKYNVKEGRFDVVDFCCHLQGGIMVEAGERMQKAIIYFNPDSSMQTLEELKSAFLNIRTNDSQNGKINLLLKGQSFESEFSLMPFKVSDTVDELSLYYNNDLLPVHDVILKSLSQPSKGIVMLHGIPGTGKTTYIRYLIHHLDRKIIYIPQNLANHIGDPSFMTFLAEHSECILVLEDAENILMERGSEKGNAMANLLNLSDGLLSDCLRIQMICTFNTQLSRIDQALLRKGRIIARYEFGKLSLEKAKALAKTKGISAKINDDLTLAELFHLTEGDYRESKKHIGF
jgi:hypothetical protein